MKKTFDYLKFALTLEKELAAHRQKARTRVWIYSNGKPILLGRP